MSPRPKRKSSAGLQAALEAVKGKTTTKSKTTTPATRGKTATKSTTAANRKQEAPPVSQASPAPQPEETCPVCGESDDIGSECHSCKRKMHHFCSHDVCRSLNIVENGVIMQEFRDMCFCSKECYYRSLTDSSSNASDQQVASNSPPAISLLSFGEELLETQIEDSIQDPISYSDLLLQKMVAFCPVDEPWMDSKKLYKSVGPSVLIGCVTRLREIKKTNVLEYQVVWSTTEFQTKKHAHWLEASKVREGVERYEQCTGNRFNDETWANLCRAEAFMEEESGEGLDDLEVVSEEFRRFEPTPLIPESAREVEMIKSMQFDANRTLVGPTDLFIRQDNSTGPILREEYKNIARHSASSCFFMYLPIAFWQMVAHATSENAKKRNDQEVSVDEIMKFLGILFYMTIVDKGEYSNYWGPQVEDAILGAAATTDLETVMPIKRFKAIRRHLAFRSGVTAADLKMDAAARIRPLMNILKSRCRRFVDVGRNVAVDESSIACRSKYARHLICYNPTKPTGKVIFSLLTEVCLLLTRKRMIGKYHFKIYVCCCSVSWLAISFKLHCHSELGVRAVDGVDAEEMLALSSIRQIVSEVVAPIENTKRIVNTDNYYTSVQLLELLRVKGLYGRGTIRAKSKHFPTSFMISKKDKLPRGSMRIAVSAEHKIVVGSWVDANVVNIVSSADDSSVTFVERQVQKEKVNYPAPSCVSEYNNGMQGVDRLDQLRARFSLADGHSFKKWHKKLALAFIDIARVNAYVTRSLVMPRLKMQRDPHRNFVVHLAGELLSEKWKQSLNTEYFMYESPAAHFEPQSTPARPTSSSNPSPSSASPMCRMSSSYAEFHDSNSAKRRRYERRCVICRLEGRPATTITQYCKTHRVSLCQLKSLFTHSSVAACPHEMSCWDKFHEWYQPNYRAYNSSGALVRKGPVYDEIWKTNESRSKRA